MMMMMVMVMIVIPIAVQIAVIYHLPVLCQFRPHVVSF